jgi:outer membrane protein assembly factor BamB
MNKKILIILCGLLQACSHVDNYLLGKDNTPKPQALEALPSKIKVENNWTVSAGGSHKPVGYNKRKPVVKQNIVYTADTKGLVQAVNAKNAKLLWSNALGQEVASGPVVENGLIALGMTDSSLVILDKTTGKKNWQTTISGEVLANPVITKDKVIVKTIDGNLYAFDSKKGNQIWIVNHGAPELVLKASSSPVVMGNLLLVGFSDGKLDAIDINTGALVWQRSIAYASGASDVERLVDIDADPIIDGKVAYIASYQGYLGAISLNDGQFLWQKPASVYKNMTLGTDTLYLTDSDDVLWSIAKNTGKVNWKQDTLKARGLTEPVLMNNHLIVGDNTGYLHVISLETGELLARSQLSGAIDSAPVATKGKLYVQTANGMLNQLSVG